MAGEPIWLTVEDALAIHDQQLEIHGGLAGIKDAGLVESALAAPRNILSYEDEDVLVLAIALWVAIAMNHGFVDGNKRTATAAMLEFLARNGYDLDVPDSAEHPLLGRLLESAIVGTLGQYELYEILIHYVRARR